VIYLQINKLRPSRFADMANDKYIYIIAEIGINHNGSVDISKELIDLAVEAGCDAVKFQKRNIDIVYGEEILSQPRKSPWGNTQRDQKQALEFSIEQYDEIDSYCKSKSIDWFASSWDEDSQIQMRKYNFPFNKIASAMATHTTFLELVASERRPTFASTGMTEMEDIDKLVEIFKKYDCELMLMHTVSTYPSDEHNLNLKCINTLKQKYNLPIGYSGHEVTISPSLVAASIGAGAVERHITLDRAMYGSDQAASLQASGLKQMCSILRKIPIVLGSPVKKVLDEELPIASKLRYWAEK
tara:strand:+ start:350 stop:1246 length:897 start_codon:yes stop_codon:yes gene_type:complete